RPGSLARLGAGVHRLRRLLGVAAIGDAPPRLLRALGLRPHVLHGRPSDAGGARGRRAQPGNGARLLHGRGIGRTGARPIRGRLARRLGGAAADAPPLRHPSRRRRCDRDRRAVDQARPAALKARRRAPGDLVPIGKLLVLRGFAAVMLSSVVTVTSLDLLVIYLPALGAERQIDADHIGLLLTVRAIASLVSRVFYARLIFAIGRAPLTLISMLGSAAGFLVLALPLSLPTMYAILIWLGFAMGIASTLTLSGVMHLAPPEVCGTALTLRMTGNRVGQIVF